MITQAKPKKHLLIPLLVLSTSFYANVTLAAANLEDTMAWVAKKVSNDFCTIPEETRINGRILFHKFVPTLGEYKVEKIEMNDRLYSSTSRTSANLRKHQGSYQFTYMSESNHYLDIVAGYDRSTGSTYRKVANSYTRTVKQIFSLEDIEQLEVHERKVAELNINIDPREGAVTGVGCWYVIIKTKKRGVDHTFKTNGSSGAGGDRSWKRQVYLSYNDESMAQRVKKALEHAVKLAKSEELF
jgi:hypothetical protein